MEDRKKVLIVDDERFNINVLTDLLKPNYKLMVAKNGLQALKAATNVNPPDLILLDIIMPKMDGFAVLKRIREDDTLKNVPVILLTNLGQEEDVKRGDELGAAGYLVKANITPSEVVDKVKEVLKG